MTIAADPPSITLRDTNQLNPDQAAEVQAMREERHETRRATVPALEEILYIPAKVLDHGFVRVIDYMGDDAAIVQAARVSYGAGTKRVRDDAGLINYLMRNWHTSPFEMCEIKLHVKLPIFVARQWIRHRTANVNEYSARYSILDREFYVPELEHVAVQSASNRQGRGEAVDPARARRVLDLLRRDAAQCYATYEELINDRGHGKPADPEAPQLARELARIDLNLSYYTQWYWKVDLHNLFHFLSLRMDPHAQYEIRVYAEAIADIVRDWVPLAFEAFSDYRLGAATLSREEIEIVRQLVRGADPDEILPASGLTLRERKDLRALLGLGPPR